MTLDDLEKIYRDAAHTLFPDPFVRIGIRAVVIALWDRMLVTEWDYDVCQRVINEILGSDAVEAADGPTREDGRTSGGVHSLPVDGQPTPAADVCVWTKEHNSPGSGWLDCKGNRHWLKSECPCCNRSIKFKETP